MQSKKAIAIAALCLLTTGAVLAKLPPLNDEQKAKAVYQGMEPLTAEDVADAILWVATRPPHVNIAEMVITPTAQGSLTKVHRG